MATTTGFPDLITILGHVAEIIPDVLLLLQNVAMLIGIYLIGGALFSMHLAMNEGSQKFFKSNAHPSIGGACLQLVIGAIFCSMATLEWMGVMSSAATGEYVNSSILSNYGTTDNSYAAQMALAFAGILGVMKIVGFTAMSTGWMMVNKHYNGTQAISVGKAVALMIGGIACWNFLAFSNAINGWLGFKVINIFGLN